jgi:hypothetical protein
MHENLAGLRNGLRRDPLHHQARDKNKNIIHCKVKIYRSLFVRNLFIAGHCQ